MREFGEEPGIGFFKYPRHHYIQRITNGLKLDVVTDEDNLGGVFFPHGEEGFNAAKSFIEQKRSDTERLQRRLPGAGSLLPQIEYRIGYAIDGDFYVNPRVCEGPFALHGDESRVGDGQLHEDADLKTQHADYMRVQSYNGSEK